MQRRIVQDKMPINSFMWSDYYNASFHTWFRFDRYWSLGLIAHHQSLYCYYSSTFSLSCNSAFDNQKPLSSSSCSMRNFLKIKTMFRKSGKSGFLRSWPMKAPARSGCSISDSSRCASNNGQAFSITVTYAPAKIEEQY